MFWSIVEGVFMFAGMLGGGLALQIGLGCLWASDTTKNEKIIGAAILGLVLFGIGVNLRIDYVIRHLKDSGVWKR